MSDMKRLILAVTLAFVAFLPTEAQFRDGTAYEALYDGEVASVLRNHVRHISAADLEGRKAGSEGEKEAASYVESVLAGYDIELLSSSGGDLFGVRTEDGDTLTSRNVIGYVEGYDRELRNSYVVVGARLDNIGTMTMTIDGKPVERIYYGANGNASGLAILLELARMVRTNSIMFRRSVIFAAFGASNEQFAGAWYFLNRSFSGVPSIDGMLNLDMLGTGYNGFYAYTSSNVDMNSIARRLSGELQPILPELVAAEPYPSDHRAFYAKEIPSVMFTTGRYPEHNTDKDTQSILDYDVMERELEYIYNYLLALANSGSAPLFRESSVSASSRSNDDVVAYFECDQRPLFLNSSDIRQFLEKWVYQYLKYPREAVAEGIQGRVMVEFIIEKDGKVTGVRVVKGVSPELDAEAVKVIEASPKWKPGRVNGDKVRTSMTIPVEFRLEKKSGRPSFGIKK